MKFLRNLLLMSRQMMKEHREFLRLAVRPGVEVYVKAVVGSRTSRAEIARAARMVAGARKDVPLILQPVAPRARRRLRPPVPPEELLALQETASRFVRDVRVIPQTHKLMGQR